MADLRAEFILCLVNEDIGYASIILRLVNFGVVRCRCVFYFVGYAETKGVRNFTLNNPHNVAFYGRGEMNSYETSNPNRDPLLVVSEGMLKNLVRHTRRLTSTYG